MGGLLRAWLRRNETGGKATLEGAPVAHDAIVSARRRWHAAQVGPKIRVASEADAPFLAWVQQEASRSHLPFGFWDLAIPGPDEYRLGALEKIAGARARSFCHWSWFLVAEVGGVPAAGLAGYSDPEVTVDQALPQAMFEGLTATGWTAAQIVGLGQRIAPFVTCVPIAEPGAWIVEWVATRPEYRGRGLIKALLQEVLALGATRGHTRAQIGVLIGNTPAQRAYESVGFRVVDEKVSDEFESTFGVPGIRRLLR